MTKSGVRFVAVLVLAAAASAGCGYERESEKKSSPTTKVKSTSVTLETGKQTLLVATVLADSGIFFTRPPYDLHGAWRTEITYGIYDEKKLGASTNAIFTLEVDRRGTTKIPTEFYGVSARYITTPAVGLQVYAYTHAGSEGQIFVPDGRRADVAIETNGTTVTFLARASGDAVYTTLTTKPLASPLAPHQAAFGVGSGKKGASIGFTNFRIPANGAPAVAPPAAQDAMNSCYLAALKVLEAVYATDGPVAGVAETNAAAGFLSEASVALDAARAKIEALPAAKSTPVSRALASLAKAEKEIDKAQAAFLAKGTKEVKPFLKSAATKMLSAAKKITDALISDDLRDVLPGNGI